MTLESQMYRQLLNTLGVNSQEEAMAEIGRLHGCSLRAEAAEAKVSRAEIRLMRVKAFRNFCGEEAKASSNGVWSLLVERLDAALNEGDGE